MSLEQDAIRAAADTAAAAPELTAAAPDPEPAGFSFPVPDLSFLKAKTGEGPIESYINDPLNFDGSRSTAQILRGATGLLGALDLAIIDIGLGILQKVKEKKQLKEQE